MKKNLIAGLLLLLIGFATFQGTYAYFTSNKVATNVVTTGNIDIDLVEKTKNDKGELVDWEDKRGIMPSELVSKIVSVKNTSTSGQPAYVRVKLEYGGSLSEEKGGTAITSAQAQSQLKLCYNNQPGYNTAKWQAYEEDGTTWYVYLGELAADGTTEPLFDGVKFIEGMDNTYQGASFTLEVSAQATQVKNNDSHGSDYTKIAGWPAA